MSTLKTRIEEAMRRNPKLSQADIARACEVKTPSVADWLNGKTKSLKPKPARLASMLFGWDQNWIGNGVGEPGWRSIPPKPEYSPDALRIAAIYDRVSPKDQQYIRAIAQATQSTPVPSPEELPTPADDPPSPAPTPSQGRRQRKPAE